MLPRFFPSVIVRVFVCGWRAGILAKGDQADYEFSMNRSRRLMSVIPGSAGVPRLPGFILHL